MPHLDSTVRVLDLDGSVTAQHSLMRRLEGRHRVLPLLPLGRKVRYLSRRRDMATLEANLRWEDRRQLTFIGSGDYHHVTAALLRRFTEPVSLLVFDTHPDWDGTSPWPCCGSWVREALAQPNIAKVVMVGLGEGDLRGWRVNVGRVKDLRAGRAAFYPWDLRESRCLGIHSLAGEGATFHPRRGYSLVRWNTVTGQPWADLLQRIVESLPTRNVYLSVDKDCLRRDDAVTNWEPGGLTVEHLVEAIQALAERRDLIGADITGEYSPIQMDRPLFRALSAWDHPRMSEPTPDNLLRNEQTNLRLLEALGF